MRPDNSARDVLRSSLDRLAESGARHLREWGVPDAQQTRAAALGLYDNQLRLHDRLVTADEFVGRPDAGGFEAAAVEDAGAHLARAEQAELARIEIAKLSQARRPLWPYAAGLALLLLLVAAVWLLGGSVAEDPQEPRLAGLPAETGVRSGSQDGNPAALDPRARTERPARESVAPSRPAGESPAVDTGRAQAAPSEANQSKAGQAASAKPSQSSASAGGSPSDQASPNDGQADERGAEQSSRASGDTPGGESQPMADQQRGDLSGGDGAEESSANQEQAAGAGAGSQRNDARSDAGQTQSENRETRNDSGAAAGQQAQSGQKSGQDGAQGQSANPGASNNNSQGKGQGASKDALKKSRGVASMILGVPIPDRVQGLPNPGLVRTVQKKIVPKDEQVAAVDAEDRGERVGPLGRIEHPELRPWQKNLVRDYFSQDAANEGEP